jgi:hypothetical protein
MRPARSAARPPHAGLRRRGAPLQQGAAGRLPAACRVGPVHLHRRHHREPVVRGQLRAAVARHGACAEVAGRRRPRLLLDRAQPAAGAAADRAAARGWWRMPTAMRRRLLNAYESLVELAGPGVPSSTRPRSNARWANAAPLRQGRRPVLRQHLGAAQVGARIGPRRRAVLAGAHARRRRRPALRGAPRAAHGQRGHRPGRPARTAPGAGRREVYERLGSPEGELAWPRPWSTWRWRRSRMPSTRPGTPCAPSCKPDGTRPGARAAAQRADAADEANWAMARATATRTTSRALCRRRTLPARRRARAPLLPAAAARDWSSASARSWRNCGRWTTHRRKHAEVAR